MSFDFRHYACPDDDHADRFEEWVEVYRFKHDLARSLGPKTILEVGVRYGYSAIAFLQGCPDATYLGIDTDDGTWGGTIGALDWARTILVGKKAEIVVGDATDEKWWHERHDLVHLDGPQDEVSWDRLIALALPRARFILLDGTELTQANREAAQKWDHLTLSRTDDGYGQVLLRGQV